MEEEPLGINSNLDDLLNSLPACRRCRANKRRCDTELPYCRNCAKAGTECIFFDHILGEDLPRSYIVSLIQNLEQVRSPKLGTITDRPRVSHSGGSQDLIPCIQGASRYLGKNSCMSQSLSIRGNEWMRPPSQNRSLLSFEDFGSSITVNDFMHHYLLATYFTQIHPLYPFLDSSLPFLSPESPSGADLQPPEAFVLQMVYSVACHYSSAVGNDLLPLGKVCHGRAMRLIDSATADLNFVTLQAITLLALHSLFDPLKGNFGQLIGFAARLAIDIEEPDTPDRDVRMRNVQTSIFSMENQVATVLDRPPFFPEPERPPDFDTAQPSEYLCSVYRIQSRFRRYGSIIRQSILERADVAILEWEMQSGNSISSNLLSALLETQLLLDPSPAVAARLITNYLHPKSIHTFLTPQWTYRAALIILEEWDSYSDASLRPDSVNAYGDSLVLLDRCALRWEAAAALSESLRSYVRNRESE